VGLIPKGVGISSSEDFISSTA